MTGAAPVNFVCPKCKRPLHQDNDALRCEGCTKTCPIVGGIPDFLAGDQSANLGMAKKVDFLAPIYETPLWHSALLALSGAAHTSIRSIASFHADTLKGVAGSLLDVACGPATYGRRIARPDRAVYGIDISMGMLRQGMVYIAREGIGGVRLARAGVEALPFEDAVFDGAICAGSLHLFPDTALALGEIARVMKPGAPLSAQAMVAGDAGLVKLIRSRRGVQAFEIPALQRFLADAGFEGFQSQQDGPSLMFSVRKSV